jgi:Kdo2-lipid IVA lauroyltransferase/acyltransferase
MKKTVGYYTLLALTWPMKFFPLSFHFLFADLLYLLIYYVFGYRKKVVSENLEKSFPQKTDLERKSIERKFYRNFADMFIETLYFSHASYKKAGKRLEVENLEMVEKLLSDGKNVIFLAGHLGNWEYFHLFQAELKAKKFFVYKFLQNKTFDQYYRRLRSRGAAPLEMKETYRTLYSCAKSGDQYIALMISDQRPLKGELSHWTTFLNQDTPVFSGTERISRKTNAAVVFSEITKVKRGHQRLRLELITEDPSKNREFEITDEFMARLEKSIIAHPDQYFWTHKRWKYKRNNNTN